MAGWPPSEETMDALGYDEGIGHQGHGHTGVPHPHPNSHPPSHLEENHPGHQYPLNMHPWNGYSEYAHRLTAHHAPAASSGWPQHYLHQQPQPQSFQPASPPVAADFAPPIASADAPQLPHRQCSSPERPHGIYKQHRLRRIHDPCVDHLWEMSQSSQSQPPRSEDGNKFRDGADDGSGGRGGGGSCDGGGEPVERARMEEIKAAARRAAGYTLLPPTSPLMTSVVAKQRPEAVATAGFGDVPEAAPLGSAQAAGRVAPSTPPSASASAVNGSTTAAFAISGTPPPLSGMRPRRHPAATRTTAAAVKASGQRGGYRTVSVAATEEVAEAEPPPHPVKLEEEEEPFPLPVPFDLGGEEEKEGGEEDMAAVDYGFHTTDHWSQVPAMAPPVVSPTSPVVSPTLPAPPPDPKPDPLDTAQSERGEGSAADIGLVGNKDCSVVNEAFHVWAHSLVGKDWEIYWDDEGEEEDGDESESGRSVAKEKACKGGGGKDDEKKDKDDRGADAKGGEEEVSDWYDATVLSYRPKSDPDAPFRIRFAGDDDTVYDMPLRRNVVRPSARAWCRRSVAILDLDHVVTGRKGKGRKSAAETLREDITELEVALPPGTSDVGDAGEFGDAIAAAEGACICGCGEGALLDRRKIVALRLVVAQQLELRSKLTKISIDDVEEEAGSSTDDPQPTEEYVNYLLSKLKLVLEASRWYESSSDVWAHTLDDRATNEPYATVSLESIQKCVSHGVSHLLNLLGIDTTVKAMEREQRELEAMSIKQQVPHVTQVTHTRRGRRKTAGRHRWREDMTGDGTEPNIKEEAEEDLKHQAEASRPTSPNFTAVGKLESRCESCERWYVRIMSAFLSRIVKEVWDHVNAWIRKVHDMTSSSNSSIETNANGNERKEYFSIKEVMSCAAARDIDPVLKHVDLEELSSALRCKLDGIAKFEAETWRAIGRCTDYPSSSGPVSKKDDDLIEKLIELKEAAEYANAHVRNMDLLGQHSISELEYSSLTRKVINDAIVVRRWVMELWWAEKHRERISFLQTVIVRAPTLPHLPRVPIPGSNEPSTSPSDAVNGLMTRLPELSKAAYSFGHMVNSYEQAIRDGQDADVSADLTLAVSLRSLEGVKQELEQLQQIPAVSVAEEMLAVRADLLRWICRASEVTSKKSASETHPPYDVVNSLEADLDSILMGTSESRLKLVAKLTANTDVDSKVRTFADTDVAAFCGDAAKAIKELHAEVAAWKGRCDTVLASLKAYGNVTAALSADDGGKDCDSTVNTTPKGVAMVELKRVSDLIAEHNEGLSVSVDKEYRTLKAVSDDAALWIDRVECIITDTSPLTDLEGCLAGLMEARESRPKGLIMEPARHVVDIWIDTLDWYTRVVNTYSKINDASYEKETGVGDIHQMIDQTAHPLILEGHEIICHSSLIKKLGFILEFKSAFVSNLKSSHRNTRILPVDKLKSHRLGNVILERILDMDTDKSNGSPIVCCYLFSWRIITFQFLKKVKGETNLLDKHDEVCVTHHDAQALYDCGNSIIQMLNKESSIANVIKDKEGKELLGLLNEAKGVEEEAADLISGCKEAVRDGLHRQDDVRHHLSRLKEIQSDFKLRGSSGSRKGLKFNEEIEETIDRKIKDLFWLVRTFSYPILHGEEQGRKASQLKSLSPSSACGKEKGKKVLPSVVASPACNEMKEVLCKTGAVPWDILVSLYERCPLSFDKSGNACGDVIEADIIRVCLRVRELYLSAVEWQEEVTQMIPVSIRGRKRRARNPEHHTDKGGSVQPVGQLSSVASGSDKLCDTDIQQLEKLAKNPILDKVNMPRHNTVCNVLAKARLLSSQVDSLFEADDNGIGVDKAPYPLADSLICRSGQFLIYRLTENPLYNDLQASIDSMVTLADELLVNTPEKHAFEWVVSTVAWVEDLKMAVKASNFDESSSKKLVIPCQDARYVLNEGFSLFLSVPDYVRKTLSRNKVFLSTNKQTSKLSVNIGKGGASHSMGGAVLRWTVLLFDCLKGDVGKLDKWEKRLLKEIDQSILSNPAKITEMDKNKILSIHESVKSLERQAQHDLMIKPKEEDIENLYNLKELLDPETKKLLHLKRKRDDIRFKNIGLIVEDRCELLSCLMKRKRLCLEMNIKSGPTEKSLLTSTVNNDSLREKCRNHFEKSFLKGMQMMGIDTDKDKASNALCFFKAWELETAIFLKFSDSHRSEEQLSSDYRFKVRSLKHNLEDIKNPTLCPRVLLGRISVPELVNMSPEALASKRLKKNRAKAEEESRRNIILTSVKDNEQAVAKKPRGTKGQTVDTKAIGGGFVDTSLQKLSKDDTKPELSMKAISKKPFSSTVNFAILTHEPARSEAKPEVHCNVLLDKAPGARKAEVEAPRNCMSPKLAEISKDKTESFPPADGIKKQRLEPKPHESNSSLPISSFSQLPPAYKRRKIAISPSPMSGKSSTEMSSPPMTPTIGHNITSNSGGDKFTFSISRLKTSFSTCLFINNTNKYTMDGFLPEYFKDKGRLPVEEFNRFVSGKLDGGKWAIVILRFSAIVSENDMFSYKKFYKEYEANKRIAMFTTGKETKLFLVTPRFIQEARCLRGKVTSKTSTYAIVLTKEKLRRSPKYLPSKPSETSHNNIDLISSDTPPIL